MNKNSCKKLPQDRESDMKRLVSTFDGMSNKESVQHQLNLWVKGVSAHNPIRDECCPDFSCCTGNIAPVEVRERFARAVKENDESVKMEMLGMFLENAFSKRS